MEEGSKNRSIAATDMNASSSRAHTIISIEFKQIEIVDKRKREKLSVIHLVDLAVSLSKWTFNTVKSCSKGVYRYVKYVLLTSICVI